MKKQIMTAALVLSLCTPLIQSMDSSAAKICLNQTKITMTKGSTRTLKVKGIRKKKSISWKSNNKKIVAVNQKGVLTAKKKGSATITARVKKQKLRCKVTVVAKKVSTAGKQETAVTSKATSASKAPAVSPTMTQKPLVSECPSLQCPVATKTPTFPWLPTFSQTPNATKTPGATKAPSATKTPVATKAPTATKTPSATKTPTPSATSSPAGGSSSTVTEESAYQILNSLRSTYPEGMPLTNSYYYYSPCFGNGYGCYGFAAKLSDTVFGTGKSCNTHTSFDKIKVGDNIRIGNSHSVIVLTKSSDAITVVEGNYNSSVHWDRRITKSSLEKDGFKVTTRY